MRVVILLLFLYLPIMTCLAGQKAKIRLIAFVENRVFPLDIKLFTVFEIQFSSKEKIYNIQNGDLAAWHVDIVQSFPNVLFIKPTIAGSHTNMTVITNLHTYYFALNSSARDQKVVQSDFYALKFLYPKKRINLGKVPSLPPPKSYHWNYSFHGSNKLRPKHVFDDGRFTYFEFYSAKNLPAIFSVDSSKGDESVINFRRQGHYLVVYRKAPQFTLRFGREVASVFNDSLIKGK